MIEPMKIRTLNQSSNYSLTLQNGEESVPINISDVENIGITVVSITAGEVEVRLTNDYEKNVWSDKMTDSDGKNPLISSGAMRTIFASPYDFLKFKAVGGIATLSFTLKNE